MFCHIKQKVCSASTAYTQALKRPNSIGDDDDDLTQNLSRLIIFVTMTIIAMYLWASCIKNLIAAVLIYKNRNNKTIRAMNNTTDDWCRTLIRKETRYVHLYNVLYLCHTFFIFICLEPDHCLPLSYLIFVNFGVPPHYQCLKKGHQKVPISRASACKLPQGRFFQ